MELVFYFLIGTVVFSFLGLVLDRFPERSILQPGSHCDYCKRRLKARDLIPILSQILNHYQCRYCKAPIPVTYLYLELYGGLLFLLTGLSVLSLAQLILISMGTLLALYDLRSQEYPFLVWLTFHILLTCLTGMNLLMWVFLFLAFLAYLVDIKMGTGDFLFLASCAGVFDLTQLLWLIQLASLLGITAFLSQGKQGTMAFVPCLLLAVYTLIFI